MVDFDTEDASVWYDKTRERYYAIFHAHTHFGMITSADGIHWEKACNYRFSGKGFTAADGSVFTAQRMERPSVWTDDQGIPQVFISSYRKSHATGVTTGIFTIPMINPDAEQPVRYEATWESLAKAPVPQWWDEGKFGIFIHWGPYSIAGYRYKNRGYAEAITNDLYKNPQNYVEFMNAKFGAAPPEFGYKDMVPLFKAEKWDPASWASLFEEAGATYVIPTGEPTS